MGRRFRGAGLVALLLAGACRDESPEPGAAPPSTASETTGSNEATPSSATGPSSVKPPVLPVGPAWNRDFPDPFILWTDQGHAAAATASGLLQVQGLLSPGLTDWTGPVEMLAEAPAWATPYSTWAPALLRVHDGYLLYYTAEVAGTDRHCISVARAATVDTPFVDVQAEPLICPVAAGGAIDPSPLRDDDGRLYLLWKNDGITLRRESAIWSQRLTDDGLDVAGDPVRLIGTDQNWEYPHVEAPSMVHVGADYWLAYSGNWWNQAAYGIGLAHCESPLGPCEKPFSGPIVASAPGREGPGGGEFFRDGSGRLLMAFHAWLDEASPA